MGYPASSQGNNQGNSPGSGYGASSQGEKQHWVDQQAAAIEAKLQPLKTASAAYRTFAGQVDGLIHDGDGYIASDLGSWIGVGKDSFVQHWGEVYSGNYGYATSGLTQPQKRLYNVNGPFTGALPDLRDSSYRAADAIDTLHDVIRSYLATLQTVNTFSVAADIIMVAIMFIPVFGEVADAILGALIEGGIMLAIRTAVQLAKDAIATAIVNVIKIEIKNMAIRALIDAGMGAGIDALIQYAKTQIWHNQFEVPTHWTTPSQYQFNPWEVVQSGAVAGAGSFLTQAAAPGVGRLLSNVGLGNNLAYQVTGHLFGGLANAGIDAGMQLATNPGGPFNWQELTQSTLFGLGMGFHSPHQPPDMFVVHEPTGRDFTFANHGDHLTLLDNNTHQQIGTGLFDNGGRTIHVTFADGSAPLPLELAGFGRHVTIERIQLSTDLIRVENPRTGAFVDIKGTHTTRTTFTVDGFGNRLRLGQVDTFGDGRVAITDGAGHIVETRPGPLPDPLHIDVATGAVDPNGSLTLPRGSLVSYDATGHVLAAIRPDGVFTRVYVRGPDGRLDLFATVARGDHGTLTISGEPSTFARQDGQAFSPIGHPDGVAPDYSLMHGQGGVVRAADGSAVFAIDQRGNVILAPPDPSAVGPAHQLPPPAPPHAAGTNRVSADAGLTNAVLATPQWLHDGIAALHSGTGEFTLPNEAGDAIGKVVVSTGAAGIDLAVTARGGEAYAGLQRLADLSGTTFSSNDTVFRAGRPEQAAAYRIVRALAQGDGGETTLRLRDGTEVTVRTRVQTRFGVDVVRIEGYQGDPAGMSHVLGDISGATGLPVELVGDHGAVLGHAGPAAPVLEPSAHGVDAMFPAAQPAVPPAGPPIIEPGKVAGQVTQVFEAAAGTTTELQAFSFPVGPPENPVLVTVSGEVRAGQVTLRLSAPDPAVLLLPEGQVSAQIHSAIEPIAAATGTPVVVRGDELTTITGAEQIVLPPAAEAIPATEVMNTWAAEVAGGTPSVLAIDEPGLSVLVGAGRAGGDLVLTVRLPEGAGSVAQDVLLRRLEPVVNDLANRTGRPVTVRLDEAVESPAVHTATFHPDPANAVPRQAATPEGALYIKHYVLDSPEAPAVTVRHGGADYLVTWSPRATVDGEARPVLLIENPTIKLRAPDGTVTPISIDGAERDALLGPIVRGLGEAGQVDVIVRSKVGDHIYSAADQYATGRFEPRVTDQPTGPKQGVTEQSAKPAPSAELPATPAEATLRAEPRLLPAPRATADELARLAQLRDLLGKEGAGYSEKTIAQIFGVNHPRAESFEAKRVAKAMLDNPWGKKVKVPVRPEEPLAPAQSAHDAPQEWDRYRKQLASYEKKLGQYVAQQEKLAVRNRLTTKAVAFALRHARQIGRPADPMRFANLYEYYHATFVEFAAHPDWFGYADRTTGVPLDPVSRADAAGLIAYGRRFDDIMRERFHIEFAQAAAEGRNFVSADLLARLSTADLTDPAVRDLMSQEIHQRLVEIGGEAGFGNPEAATYHPHKHAEGLVQTPVNRYFPLEDYKNSAATALREGSIVDLRREDNGSIRVEVRAVIPDAAGTGLVGTNSVVYLEQETGRIVLATHQMVDRPIGPPRPAEPSGPEPSGPEPSGPEVGGLRTGAPEHQQQISEHQQVEEAAINAHSDQRLAAIQEQSNAALAEQQVREAEINAVDDPAKIQEKGQQQIQEIQKQLDHTLTEADQKIAAAEARYKQTIRQIEERAAADIKQADEATKKPAEQTSPQASDPLAKAESALQEALRVVAPDATRMADGSLQVNGPDGQTVTVPADALDRLAGHLAGRAADGATAERLQAEAAAQLGRHIATATGGSATDGALEALRRLADHSPQEVQAATAVMREVIAGSSAPVDPAVARLLADHPPAPDAVLRASAHDAASGEITERIENLFTQATTPDPQLPDAHQPDTAAAGLTDQIHGLVDSLHDDIRALDERVLAKVQAAENAAAPDMQARNKRIAGAYEEARKQAVRAQEAYQRLLDHLESGTANLDTARELADQAGKQLDLYRQRLTDALPDDVVLPSSTPTGPMPHLRALTKAVNEALAEQNVERRFTAEELSHVLRAEFRRVAAPDGVVLSVGKAELRIQLHISDLVEVLDPPAKFGESLVGELPQGGQTTGATIAYGQDLTVGGDAVKAFAALSGLLPNGLPNPWSHVIDVIKSIGTNLGHWVGVSGTVDFGWQRSVSETSREIATFGGVEDNRAEATLFKATGRWKVSGRPSPTATFTEPELVATGVAGDAASLQLQIAHAYTAAAPQDVVQLLAGERQQVPFPEHVVTGLTGLHELSEATIRSLDEQKPLSDMARQQVRTMLTETAPSHLHEAINDPHGLERVITDRGRAVAVVRLRTRVVRLEEAKLVGDSGVGQWQERLRVGYTGAGGSETLGASVTRGVSFSTPKIHDLPGQSDGGLSFSGTYASAHADTAGVGGDAIHPSVQRYQGHTQGYRMVLEHEVTIDHLGKSGSLEPITQDGKGLFRIPEPDAYRYGLPVDAAAITTNADGVVVLRDDPSTGPPPGRKGELPSWIGKGPGQMRGAGPALVQRITGPDEILHTVEKGLRDVGVLPKLKDGRPQWSSNPEERAAQLINARTVAEQLSPRRLETGYDQASQDGIIVDLVRIRPLQGAEHVTMRIRLDQQFDKVTYVGLTSSETVVNLDISSLTTSRSHNDSVTWSGGADPSLGHSPGTGHPGEGWSGDGAFGGNRGHTLGWSAGDTGNEVALTESTAPSAVFKVPHTLHVELLDNTNKVTLLASHDGTARVLWPSDMLPEDRPAPAVPSTPAHAGQPSPEVMDRATVQHLDAELLPVARKLLGLRQDSAAFRHLASFLGVRDLVANTEWMRTPFQTDLVVRPEGLLPRTETISVEGTVRSSEFVSKNDLVVGDINLTLGSSGHATTDSHGWNFGPKGGGSENLTELGGSDYGGSLSPLSRSADTSHTDSQLDIWGRERLTIEVGKQYMFKASVDFHLSVGKATDDVHGTMVYTLPERDALLMYGENRLELPLHEVSDAVERFRNGTLQLDRNTAASLIQHYIHDLAEAGRQGDQIPLATEHTPEALLQKLESVAGASPLTQSGAEHRLDEALNKISGMAPEKVALPEHLHTKMGTSLIESLRFAAHGERTELFDGVMKTVGMKVSPKELNADPTLRMGLFDTFAGRRAWGHIDKMGDSFGFTKEFPIRGGRPGGRGDLLTVRMRMEIQDEATLVGQTKKVVQIVQDYRYLENDRSVTKSVSYSVGGGGSGGVGDVGGDGSLGTGRSRSGTDSTSEQLTRLQRFAQFNGMDRIEQRVKVTVEVERSPLWTGDVRDLPQSMARALPRAEPDARVSLEGTMTRLVGTGMARPIDESPATIWRPTDPRTVDASGVRFFTDSTGGEHSYKVLVDTLADRQMLGPGARARIEQQMAHQWSATARNAYFEQILGEGGRHMWVQENGRRVEVVVRGRLSDMRPVSGIDGAEIGEVDRIQRVAGSSGSAGRLWPLNRGLDGKENIGISLGFSSGQQASESIAEGSGNRNETSIFERANTVTVYTRVNYDITVSRDGKQIQATAHDYAYLTMFEHDYQALLARQETGSTAQPWRLDSPAQWTSPYVVYTDPPRPSEPLTQALMTAQLEHKEVHIEIRSTTDGTLRRYGAYPDGTLRSEDGWTDGGYAAAFATLPPDLPALADAHHIDLHQLFNADQGPGSFADKVRAELRKLGVKVPDVSATYRHAHSETETIWQGDATGLGGFGSGSPGGI